MGGALYVGDGEAGTDPLHTVSPLSRVCHPVSAPSHLQSASVRLTDRQTVNCPPSNIHCQTVRLSTVRPSTVHCQTVRPTHRPLSDQHTVHCQTVGGSNLVSQEVSHLVSINTGAAESTNLLFGAGDQSHLRWPRLLEKELRSQELWS